MNALEIYERLYAAYGQPRWWSENPYLVMVQSILVQNTPWSSVEKLTAALSERLTPQAVASLDTPALESLIRPCGFSKAKAAAIQRLTQWYARYAYDPEAVKALAQPVLRGELLSIKGIGAETADVILLFAFHKPSFVLDAYTRRFLERLGFSFHADEERRRFFESDLEPDYRLYGWYHWLLLQHGIDHCRKTPVCDGCPFNTSHGDRCKSAL